MSSSVVKNWSDYHVEDLTEWSIRNCFRPPSAYRVTVNRYPAKARFAGVTKKGTCFVLDGECEWHLPEVISLKAGQFAEVPAGKFEFVVRGEKEVQIVNVWPLSGRE